MEELRRLECVSSLRIGELHEKQMIHSLDLIEDHRKEVMGSRAKY